MLWLWCLTPLSIVDCGVKHHSHSHASRVLLFANIFYKKNKNKNVDI
jgi:hypothetical protein